MLALNEDILSINQVIAAALRIVQGQVEKAELTLTVEKSAAEDLYLWGDERKIKQILINLLSNAVKFTPAGGSITIVSTVDRKQGLSLSVRDTGIGVAPENITKIVEPFMQVDDGLNRKYEGTGLGLSLVRSFAQLHGGKLTIESALGSGTTVSILFPPDRIRDPLALKAAV